MEAGTYKNVQKSRIRLYRERLIDHLHLLTLTLIILSYVKFGGNVFIFMLRCFSQSVISVPLTTDNQVIRQVMLSRSTRIVPQVSQVDDVLEEEETENRSETQSPDSETEIMIKKIFLGSRRIVFHIVFTFNWLVILSWILFPTDYRSKLKMYNLNTYNEVPGTQNSYNNEDIIIRSEWSDTWFVQFMGEAIPTSNLYGNMSAILYQIMIFISQLCLYLLLFVYFFPLNQSRLPNQDEDIVIHSDEYNGVVKIAVINPIEAVQHIRSQASRNESQEQVHSSHMV